MRGFLLDTNAISEAVSIRPDPNVMAWMQSVDERLLFLSALTIGEIRKGIDGLSLPSKRRDQLEAWLDHDLLQRFAGRILSIDSTIAERWGALSADLKRRGVPMPVVDALVAATALHYDLTVVSRNVADFRNAGVSLINPWESV
ncbi:MAG: type II toxin-antitoxin system VapC family toxin [Bryobacterales bacterium]|nr:type II toxin-antitoxin system VapC family toxin [Bryobacterales bacterium]